MGCENYKSEKGCTFGDKCRFRQVEAEGKPSKRSKKGGAKGSGALLKESIQLGCASQDSYPRKSIVREPGKLESKHAVKIFQRHLAQKGPLRGIIQECAPHARSPCGSKFGEISHEETLHQEGCARNARWDCRIFFTSSRIPTKPRSKLLLKQSARHSTPYPPQHSQPHPVIFPSVVPLSVAPVTHVHMH